MNTTFVVHGHYFGVEMSLRDQFVYVQGGLFSYGMDHSKWYTQLPDWERNRMNTTEECVKDFEMCNNVLSLGSQLSQILGYFRRLR